MFESLESRTLMSATLANGTLTITETNVNDTVLVGKDAQGKLFVTENGVPTLFLWNAVNKVVANLMGGNDSFSAQDAVNKPLEIHGGDGNDTVKGGSAGDALFGDNGSDLLDGRGGNDDTHGGADVDTADYSDRTVNLNISLDDVANDGGVGAADNIHSDVEVVLCGYGNDTVTGSNANNTITGSGGNDVIKGMGGDDWLDGGVGGVAVYGQNTGNDNLEGGDGKDTLHASDYGNCSLYGQAGNDYMHGWGGKDYLSGGDGDDVMYGGANDDVMYGGAGSDYVYGEDGNDNINGDNGYANARDVRRFVDATTRYLPLQPIRKVATVGVGLGGATPGVAVTKAVTATTLLGPVVQPTSSLIGTVITQLPPIILTFAYYDDYLSGGNGNDTVRGNQGNDTCAGDAGNDRVYGDDGNDNLSGNDGNDQIFAGAGNDFSSGGNGDDVLVSLGGGTSDTTAGNAGRDEFWVDDAANEWVADADFWSESLPGTVHRVGVFANGASKELTGQNLTDPDATNNRAPYTAMAPYRPDTTNFADRPLFSDAGPAADDIVQGQVGDCYFLAGLSSTARVDRNRIKDSVVDLGDGSYAVRFMRNGAWTYYRVDGDLPTYNGTNSPYYANLGAQQSIWAPVMEKAFAFFRSGGNSYNSLHGGGMNEPYDALAGSPSNLWDGSSQWNTLLNIKNALLGGKAVSVLTPNADPPAGTNAVKWHVYSAVSVQTTKVSLPFGGFVEIPLSITLRNPWGTDGGGNNDGNNDGYVTFTASQFFGYFTGAVGTYI